MNTPITTATSGKQNESVSWLRSNRPKAIAFCAASLLLSCAVRATDAIHAPVASSANVVYRAVDSQGRTLFQLTITDPHAVTLRLTSHARPRTPRLHWTALIGTGEAASAEEKP